MTSFIHNIKLMRSYCLKRPHERNQESLEVIKRTSIFVFFPVLKYTRPAINGIIVKTGIFVNIAMPRQSPEKNTMMYLFLASFVLSANSIDDKRNGNNIESKSILRITHVNGMTANKIEMMPALFFCHILYQQSGRPEVYQLLQAIP